MENKELLYEMSENELTIIKNESDKMIKDLKSSVDAVVSKSEKIITIMIGGFTFVLNQTLNQLSNLSNCKSLILILIYITFAISLIFFYKIVVPKQYKLDGVEPNKLLLFMHEKKHSENANTNYLIGLILTNQIIITKTLSANSDNNIIFKNNIITTPLMLFVLFMLYYLA